MAWELEGFYVENCNCDAICPCTWSNLAREATYDDCRATLGFRIERGQVDGVDVAGRTMVLSLVSPKLMIEGNWRAGLVFDADTTDEQMQGLTNVFTGALGGPMAGLAPLIGEFLGTERADISARVGRRRLDVAGRRRHAPRRLRRPCAGDRCGGDADRDPAPTRPVRRSPSRHRRRCARHCSASSSRASRGAASAPRSAGPPEPMTTAVGAEKRRAPASSTLVLLVLAGVAWIATIVWIVGARHVARGGHDGSVDRRVRRHVDADDGGDDAAGDLAAGLDVRPLSPAAPPAR